MPTVKQLLSGLVPQNGPTAFMPMRVLTTATRDNSRGQNRNTDQQGFPGTKAIPAPYPVTLNNLEPSWYTGGLSESIKMPPVWYPSLYWQDQDLYRGIGGVSVYSDNLMPMPAIDPRGLPAGIIGPAAFAASRRGASGTPTNPARPNKHVKGLGSRQVTWPKKLTRWAGWNE